MEKQNRTFANGFMTINAHYDSLAILLISTLFTIGIFFVSLSNNLCMSAINIIMATLLSTVFFYHIKLDFKGKKQLFKLLFACVAIQTLALLGFCSENTDICLKNIGVLNPLITHMVIIVAIIGLTFFVITVATKITMYIRYLGSIAYEDPVTKLPNWCYFNTIIAKRLKLFRSRALLMAIWDIQNLAAINASVGVAEGNQILKEVTGLLKRNTPNNAWIARSGGSKFVLIIPHWNEYDLNQCIPKCFDALNHLTKNKPYDDPVNIVAYDVFNYADATLDSIFRALNFTLLHARTNGQIGIIKHEASISKDYEMEDIIISGVEKAIQNKAFDINFQGKFHIESKRICGFEALTRWNDDKLRDISPGFFVPIINRSRHMKVFNEHILALSMQKFNEIQSCVHTPFTLALNLSPLYLLHDGFPEAFEQMALDKKVPLTCIILEITEDVLIHDYEKAKKHINSLRGLGVRFSLDDFGTGFSSLWHLSYLDIQEVKLDKTIVQSAVDHDRTLVLIDSIAKLAQNMGCELVAEGVETEDHYRLAERIGCTQVQGYYVDLPSTTECVKSKIFDATMMV